MLFASDKNTGESGRRFSIDAKLVGIMSVVAFLGILLVAITILAAETLSALRSFSTLQTHWTEVRKETTGTLELYITTDSNQYFEETQKSLGILQDVEKVRIEITREQTDVGRVSSLLEPFQFRDEEIRNMIKTYNRFGGFPEFAETVRIWEFSDRIIERLDSLATHIRERKQENPESDLPIGQWIETIEETDAQLTVQQYDLAMYLDRGAQRLENVIFWSAIGIAGILILVGGFMSRRFLKSIHKWEHTLKMNAQKYRSLYDHNPNAVYSFNRKGEFVDGNKVLENMLETSMDQIQGVPFDQFVHPSERERARNYFEKAANGEPQNYEIVGLDSDGEKLYLQVTNLPIYIDDEIVGVYGIAQDIEERVEAEQKIEAQLKEKTILLEEIHHRVKNNLAFVSSMLMLQEETIENKKARYQLLEAQNQIFAIADVHEIIYDTENFSELPVELYVNQILKRLSGTLEHEDKTIEHKVEADDIVLSTNDAIPFGLIVNELATNSYKHAFENREEGSIELQIQSDNGKIKVSYRDNGKGVPADFDFEEIAQSSLGMRLIYTFLQQLNADYRISGNGDGFWLEFSFET